MVIYIICFVFLFVFFLYLLLASDVAEKERSTERRRKNSDSFLILTPKEDEVTLMKLKQAKNKLNFKIQILQKEIEKLKTEVAEEEPVQICKNTGETGRH